LALASIATGFTPLATRLGNVWVKHTITKRSMSAWITVVALHPVVFRVIVFIFSQGKTKMIE
jgi:hypothetical protein